MIPAKSIRIKGLPAETATETLTISNRFQKDSITIPKLQLEYDSTDELPAITEVKSQVEVIIDSLKFFPESGLAGAIIYNFVKNYYKKNEVKIPERDVIYSALKRLMDNGTLERVKRDNVWWYKLAT